jgi:DNA-binding NarL/FixJ family response regulator
MIIESISDMAVVGEAKDGHDALVQAEALRPDVIIMDIAMPEMNGIEATRIIYNHLPLIKIIILSMHNTSEHVYRSIQAGASAYILKESVGSCVVDAVRAVMKGKLYFDDGVEAPIMLRSISPCSHPQSPINSLSPRELEVIQYVVEGKTSAEIAKILAISPKSIDTYRSRLMLKLGVTNIPSLVKFAILHGITSTK